ncbi:hypothetical protein DFS33DRAFT_1386910 [Desarmillaria ectypa]|nr:hypothetical protein DFS33DRAFT_1386910 [Desarmillaria ectypa]
MKKININLQSTISSALTEILAACFLMQTPREQIADWLNNYLAYNQMYETCQTYMQGTGIIVYQFFDVGILNLALIK